ncbi:MAG: DsbA family protein [Chloroflexi bacterium]|nr:DsbA family protein [Chloroflexota bacterium]
MSMEKKSKRQERREKIRSQAQRTRLMMIGLIVAGAALLVFAVVWTQTKSIENIITVSPVSLPNANGLTIGDPNATVSIDVFEDFQCPACQYFSESIEPLIVQYLVEPGKATYTFHNYPFIDGPGAAGSGESDQSANAAMCANEQGKFWDMKAIIYANWNGENQGGLSNIRLKAMAENIGLDMSSFNSCFNANKYEDEIQADFEYGQEIGVSGTPSVFVNGAKVGQPGKIPTYQEIAEAVELALAASQ